MCCRLLRTAAVACLLLVVLAGAVWYGLGATSAQEATPTSPHGHGRHASPETSALSPYADDADSDAPIRSLTPEQIAAYNRLRAYR